MRAWKVAEFNETVLPTPSWVVPGLVPGSGWTLIIAPPKTGKSVFAEQMVYALALGEKFLYWPIERPWRVTFVEADAPDGDLQKQTRAIMPKATENLDIIIPDSRQLLRDLAESQKVAQRIKDHGAEFVVFDALEPLAGPSLDLNTQQGVQSAINVLKGLAGNKPFMLIHHPRKQHPNPEFEETDVRNMAAGHHYLTANSTASLSIKADTRYGKLNTIGRRGGSKEYLLERLPVNDEVFIWITVAETKKTPTEGPRQAPPDGRSLGALFEKPA